MRILIFSLAYYPVVGGAEVAVKEITDRIPGIDFDMVTMRFDTTHPAHERIGNVNVYRIGGGLGYLSKVLFVPQAALFARRRKYDLYWSLMTYMTFPVVLGRMLADRTPYVITLQDGDPFERVFERARIKMFLPLLLYGFRRAARIQAISNFLADWAGTLGYKKKVEVIPNGVDIKKFSATDARFSRSDLGLSETDKVLITTSRLVEKNGVGDVIDSLRHLPENVKFLILGTGPLEESLKAQAQRLGLEKRALFLGYISHDEMPKYLKVSDIFIRPSLSEGMGNSFIEAMAAGIPVIATPVGGIPDFLFDPDKAARTTVQSGGDPDMPATGLFVNVRDSKSIAVQVSRLLSDNALRQTLIENGRRLAVEKYDWSLIAAEMRSRVFGI